MTGLVTSTLHHFFTEPPYMRDLLFGDFADVINWSKGPEGVNPVKNNINTEAKEAKKYLVRHQTSSGDVDSVSACLPLLIGASCVFFLCRSVTDQVGCRLKTGWCWCWCWCWCCCWLCVVCV